VTNLSFHLFIWLGSPRHFRGGLEFLFPSPTPVTISTWSMPLSLQVVPIKFTCTDPEMDCVCSISHHCAAFEQDFISRHCGAIGTMYLSLRSCEFPYMDLEPSRGPSWVGLVLYVGIPVYARHGLLKNIPPFIIPYGDALGDAP